MASRDAELNDLIRLKKTPAPPIQRWQMMPTKQSLTSVQRISSPLRCTANTLLTAKTPERSRLAVKYKKTPKVKSPTCYKTPNHKTTTSTTTQSLKKKSPPKSSARKKTPGGRTPGGCRFIPNRYVGTQFLLFVYNMAHNCIPSELRQTWSTARSW